jgi:hypothetical protein
MKEEDFRRIIREELLKIFPHQDFLQMINEEIDTVKLFLDKFKYIPSSINKIPMQIFYNDYRDFCIDSKNIFLSKTDFSKNLHKLKIKVSRMNIGNVVNIEIL